MSIDIKVERSGNWTWRGIRALVSAADKIGPELRDEMKKEAPVGNPMNDPHPGRLRDSIRYSRTTTSAGVRMSFTAHTPYAGYVIGGTGPHIISARAARSLRWMTPSGSRFARQVHHPGTEANPFPRRAMERKRTRVIDILSSEVGQ